MRYLPGLPLPVVLNQFLPGVRRMRRDSRVYAFRPRVREEK